jgi:hypothetical protein
VMLSIFLLLGIGLLLLAVIVAARLVDAALWRSSLRAYTFRPPSTLRVEDVTRWLASVSATTHATGWSLLPLPPVCVEIIGTVRGIEFRLLVSRRNELAVLSGLRATMPGVRLEELEGPVPRPIVRHAAEATLTTSARPLNVKQAEAVNAALLGALQPLSGTNEQICIQWIFTSAGTPPPVHSAAPGKDAGWSAYLLEGEVPTDAEAVRALRLKRQEGPLLHAVVRIGVNAPSRERALRLFGRVWPQLHGANAVGARVVRRWLPSRLVVQRMARRDLPVTRWPLLLNVSELATLLGLPVGGPPLPGLSTHSARQLPPPPQLPTRGVVVGVSNFPGMTKRLLALRAKDMLHHQWITAPTGGGKSTLMARMALSSIEAGYGAIVIDPKNDQADDLLSRIPDDRLADVIVLDLADLKQSVGLNVLRAGRGEHGRELVADNVVHVFSELWRSSWGPRTSDVLRNAILTLTHTAAPDGSAFTLCEVAELLTNLSFRQAVLDQPSVPETVRTFWYWYDGLSDPERTQVIAPSLNKLRSLTTRSSLRLALGQSVGIDLGLVFRERKILLVKLSKGIVGESTAQMLGALVLAGVWQTALTRMAIPREHRRPVFCFLDEFVDLVKLPVPLATMLSQARGLGLSLTLASQFAAQLPESVRGAVMGTVRTHIAMQQDFDDAKVLAKRFAPLTADDLMGLEAFEFAMRPLVNGRTLAPVTGTSLPLSKPLRNGQELAARSRERWGMPRRQVEAGLRARIGGQTPRSGRFGRILQGNGEA